jgi:hypothetical protein
MTTPHDVVPAPESLTFSNTSAASRRSEDGDQTHLAREINERRARVENSELLQHLRGL